MREFKDKTAVITGAASGIGKALAGKCASEGMKVVLADIEGKPLYETEKALKESGADVIAVKTDVSDFKDIENLAQKTIGKFGAVHLLCNNAGVGPGGLVWENSLQDWEWTIGVNLWGVIYGIKVFTPIMLKQGTECHIVNTASAAGLIAGPFQGIYNVTKFGVVALTETMYTELKITGSKIGISVLCPGYVSTNIYNMERNRPEKFRNPASTRILTLEEEATIKSLAETVKNSIINGMPPEKCADIVFDAIREEKLYILPHQEYNQYIKSRAENITDGRNPGFT